MYWVQNIDGLGLRTNFVSKNMQAFLLFSSLNLCSFAMVYRAKLISFDLMYVQFDSFL